MVEGAVKPHGYSAITEAEPQSETLGRPPHTTPRLARLLQLYGSGSLGQESCAIHRMARAESGAMLLLWETVREPVKKSRGTLLGVECAYAVDRYTCNPSRYF